MKGHRVDFLRRLGLDMDSLGFGTDFSASRTVITHRARHPPSHIMRTAPASPRMSRRWKSDPNKSRGITSKPKRHENWSHVGSGYALPSNTGGTVKDVMESGIDLVRDLCTGTDWTPGDVFPQTSRLAPPVVGRGKRRDLGFFPDAGPALRSEEGGDKSSRDGCVHGFVWISGPDRRRWEGEGVGT